MLEVELSYKVLFDILYNGVRFKDSLRKVLKNDNSEVDKNIRALVGCELRHHLLFISLLKNEIDYSNEQRVYLYLALANKFFLHAIDDKKLKEFVDEKITNVNHKNFDELYQKDESPLDLINLDRNSVDFISVRFNTPKWLIKMWNKHFGKSNTFKILKRHSKPIDRTFSINTLHLTYEELIKRYPDKFEKTKFSNLVVSKNKFNVFKTSEYRKGELSSLRLAAKEVIEKYHNPLINEFSFYSASDNSLVHEFLVKSSLETGINIAIPSLQESAEILHYLRVEKARNINLFEAKDAYSMKAGISRKQEIFYVYPKSSSFDKISFESDFFVHFNRDLLDKIILDQTKSLELVAPYIMDDGLLIYMVDTINKKESEGIISTFLINHNEFELVEEKQQFVFEENECNFYYAVLRRKANND